MTVFGRLRILFVLAMLFLTGSGPAKAGPLEDGLAALNSGDYKSAFDLFRPLAKQGDAKAQMNLGLIYEEGLGRQADDAEAMKWYRKAAEQGVTDAQSTLGLMYTLGRGVKKVDQAMAAQWFSKAAAQGDASAQGLLGAMYANGNGVPQDYAEAVKWLRKAAEQGNAAAQHNLGVAYYNGQGVPKDYAEAAKWFRRAAETDTTGFSDALVAALLAVSKRVPQDRRSLRSFRRTAEAGVAYAQSELGAMCAAGKGVPQDAAEAAKWFHRADNSQNNLGMMFSVGVDPDPAAAMEHFREAAVRGFALAQRNLGAMYLRQYVAASNSPAAIMQRMMIAQWDAEHPNRPAQQPKYQVCADAEEWFRKAAEQGDAEAATSLETMYSQGLAVRKPLALRPERTAPPPASTPGKMSGSPASKQAGSKWLADAATAAGGAGAWAAVRSVTAATEASLSIQGQTISVSGTESWRFPDHKASSQKLPSGEVHLGLDGATGWFSGLGRLQDIPRAAEQNAKEWERSLWRLFGESATIELSALEAPEVVDGVPYRAASLGGAKTQDLVVLFTTEGRLAGFAYQDEGAGQLEPARVVTLFSEWSAEGAIQYPHAVKMLRDGKPVMDSKLTSLQLNPTLADSIFEKPTK